MRVVDRPRLPQSPDASQDLVALAEALAAEVPELKHSAPASVRSYRCSGHECTDLEDVPTPIEKLSNTGAQS